MDRLSRSLRHLIDTVNGLQSKGVEFISLQEKYRYYNARRKARFHVFGAPAEFERELSRARTQAGIKAARARGIKNGRLPKLTKAQVQMAKTLMKNSASKSSEICEMLKISRSTLYRCCSSEKKTAYKSA